MKPINKQEPQFYAHYIRKKKPVDWEELSKDIGTDIRKYMLLGLLPDENSKTKMSEQNSQCAYTEVYIEPEGDSSHIDHFCKQDLFPKLKFEWSNLFASTNHGNYGAKFKDNKFKIQHSDYQFLINPVKKNPDEFFSYTFRGRIEEKNKDKNSIQFKKAKTTIEVFNLNEKSLANHRETVAKQVITYFSQSFSIDEIKAAIGQFDSFIEFVYFEYSKLVAESFEKKTI